MRRYSVRVLTTNRSGCWSSEFECWTCQTLWPREHSLVLTLSSLYSPSQHHTMRRHALYRRRIGGLPSGNNLLPLWNIPGTLTWESELELGILCWNFAKWNILSIVKRTHLRGHAIRTRFSVHESNFQAWRRYIQMESFTHNSSPSLAAPQARSEGLIAEDSKTLTFNRQKMPISIVSILSHGSSVPN